MELKKLETELKLKGFSERTIKTYLFYNRKFLEFVRKKPEEVNEEDVKKAIEKSVREIVTEIKNAIEETPPELVADIMLKGIYLTGGGALLRGLDALIAKEARIPTKIVEDPLTAVVRGAGAVLENLDELEKVLAQPEEMEVPKE